MSLVDCSATVSGSVSGTDRLDCDGDSFQYPFVSIMKPPSAIQKTRICASSRCMRIVASIKKAQPTECIVASGVALYKEVINPIEAVCAEAASNSSMMANATVAVLPSPAPPVSRKDGLSSTAISAIGGGSVVGLLLVLSILSLWWRRRNHKLERPLAPAGSNSHDRRPGKHGFAYVDLSDAPTDGTADDSEQLHGGSALAAVRIPYKYLQLGDVVSQGGFGEVLHGIYRNEVVAIKRLLASRYELVENIQGFFREIQLTASLDHECIVKFIGVAWDVPTNLCMVSEFMYGGDLRSLLVRYARDKHANGHDDGKLRMAVHVAHALTYLHSLDIPVVHRDLKSRNVLLTESMDAKVIDFGISCERQDVTMTAGVGTSLWMAPEVMLGKRYDEKADVFSFGVILSELDTHALPYDHAIDPVTNKKAADIVLLNLICDGKLQAQFTDKADPTMVELARECLQVDPANRPFASDVLYRIHLSRQHDRTLTAETRTAITRSLNTAETVTRTRSGGTSST